jgi:NAD(P)-dependent dehydrogenase (short-subunit alcohol dehydrogenase family)
VVALTENLAAANARYGVRANAVLPGLMNAPMGSEGPRRPGREPRGGRRVARSARAAAPARHSDEVGFVTGVALAVDGGEGVSWGS